MRRLGPDDWRLWRDLRLAALAESPRAFGSTLEREAGYTERQWRDWLHPARGLKAVADHDAGLVGAWVPDDRHGAVELYSLWVDPGHRGRGVAGLLVEEALAWAGDRRVDLWVVEGNDAATRLYVRHGFRPTGERQPHPTFEGVVERAMTREPGS